MEQVVLNVLSGYGLAGVCILTLGFAVLQQWRMANKVSEARLAERDILIKALENNTRATKDNADAIIARNVVTEELGRAIERQATVIELFMQKNDLHDESVREKLADYKQVIESFSEAVRTNTAIVRDVRDRINPSNRRGA